MYLKIKDKQEAIDFIALMDKSLGLNDPKPAMVAKIVKGELTFVESGVKPIKQTYSNIIEMGEFYVKVDDIGLSMNPGFEEVKELPLIDFGGGVENVIPISKFKELLGSKADTIFQQVFASEKEGEIIKDAREKLQSVLKIDIKPTDDLTKIISVIK